MQRITIYNIMPDKSGLINANFEAERITQTSSAIILHSRGGGPPPRNPEYQEALRHILGRLLKHDRLSVVLIDSARFSHLPREERVLCTKEELDGLSGDEAARIVGAKARLFGQASGAKGGNSTKRLRIETDFPLHSLVTSLRAEKVTHVDRSLPQEGRERVPRTEAVDLLAGIEATEDDVRCVENDIRMAGHFRTERSRSHKLVDAKREAVRSANQGRLACEYEGCPADWYTVYPPAIAEGVFEVHHRVPLSQLDGPIDNGVDDLQMLCAACHRAEHRRLSGA